MRRNLSHEPWPILGASVAGATGLAIASAIGAAELAVGAVAAYAAFRLLRGDSTGSKKSLRETSKSAHGTSSKTAA